ncbi:chorismate mutase [Acidithiobacillus ferriphilus]|nr:chorismate mutase [Acidithiobacillus ferriphilus]
MKHSLSPFDALPQSKPVGQQQTGSGRWAKAQGEIFLINSVKRNFIEEIRSNIDRIDRQIVTLLAQRGAYVKQAAKFKKTTTDVKAPQRVERVIAKVVALSVELGANPTVTEQVYRAMIAGFINAELAEHAALNTCSIEI